jgi:hypothetical protein
MFFDLFHTKLFISELLYTYKRGEAYITVICIFCIRRIPFSIFSSPRSVSHCTVLVCFYLPNGTKHCRFADHWAPPIVTYRLRSPHVPPGECATSSCSLNQRAVLTRIRATALAPHYHPEDTRSGSQLSHSAQDIFIAPLSCAFPLANIYSFYFLSASGQKRNVLLLCLILVAEDRVACPPRAGPLNRGALGHGLHRLCLNPPLSKRQEFKGQTWSDEQWGEDGSSRLWRTLQR